MVDYLSHIRSDSTRFRDVLAELETSSPVPTCPRWTVADLIWHLTEVQWFWGAIVSRRAQDPTHVEHDRPHRVDDSDLIGAFDHHSWRLAQALEGASADEMVYTWDRKKTIGWVARRQAHEALIHRVDAEMVRDNAGQIDAAIAEDGIDEVITVMLPSTDDTANFESSGITVRITATDRGRQWGIAYGTEASATHDDLPGGRRVVSVGVDAARPDTRISGTARDLDLWLWGRGNLESLTVDGPVEHATRLRSILSDETR